MSDTNTELSYVLPSEAVKKGCFERLFQVRELANFFSSHSLQLKLSRVFGPACVWCFSKALDHSLDRLALTSFGVMDTTLEEVFLKVSEEDHSLENSDAGDDINVFCTYICLILTLLSKCSNTVCLFVDVKGSPSRSSSGKSSPPAEGGPSAKEERPAVELSNLVMCSRLSQSQSSLKSSSSVGSVRGDEGGLYADFYGDYCPLFDNGQDSDSASLRGQTTAS